MAIASTRGRLKKTRIQGNTVAAGVPVAASLSTTLTGTNNDITVTANARGTVGNDYTLTLVDPSANSQSLAVTVGGTATKASLSTALTGTNNDLDFTAVERDAYGNSVTIAYVDPSANSAALSVVVTGKAIVVNLATGSGGAITSTAAQVKAAIEAHTPASRLVTVANKSGNDGTGVVTALAATALSGGKPGSSDISASLATNGGGTITTTAALLIAAINAHATAGALVTAANKTGNDGTGVVTALAKTSLSGGTDYTLGASGSGLATRRGR